MSHIPSQGPYVDTLILDCSRQTSEEVKGNPTDGKNAIFTNKLGNGIKINPGDKISVSSAYVSERGCGGQVIEFKGEVSADQSYTLYETVITKSQLPNKFPITGATATGLTNLTAPRNLNHPAPFADFGPLGAKKVVHTKVAKTFPLQDNEVNVEISFYKSTNGEGYFHLPRRYDIKPPPGEPQVVGTVPGEMTHRQPNLNNPDMLGQSNATSLAQAVNYDCPYNGRACVSPRITKLCPADWYIYTGLQDCGVFTGDPLAEDVNFPNTAKYMLRSTCPIGVPRAGGLWDVDTGSNQKIYKQVGHDGHAFQDYQMKQKNDNSRYTIYAKELCYYSEYVGDAPGNFAFPAVKTRASATFPTYEVPNSFAEVLPEAGSDRYGTPYLSRDDLLGTVHDDAAEDPLFRYKYNVCYDKEPSCSGYTRYTEIKNLKVPKGFNSPSNVAETLTNQLNQTKEQRTIHGVSGSYLGPYKENILNTEGIDGADVGENYKQGPYDSRYYNQDSEANGFYNDEASNDALARSTYGSTLGTGQRQVLVSTILESETLKSFACGNSDTWNEDNFIGYRGQNPRDVGLVAPDARQIQAIDAVEYPRKWSLTPPRENVNTPREYGVQNMVTSDWIEDAGVANKLLEIKPEVVQNVQYLSNYQYIGVKRPELFDAYREFHKPELATSASWRNFDSFQCLTGIENSEFATHPFITTCEYTPANLLRFKAVFDAQAKYPEIFEEYQYSNVEEPGSAYNRIAYPEVAKGVSPDYMRFLHINSWSGTQAIQKGAWRPDATTPIDDNPVTDFPVYNHRNDDAARVPKMPLGNDNCNTPLTDKYATDAGVSTWATINMKKTAMDNPLNQSRNAQDLASAPLFVWYNEADKDNTLNNGRQDANLAYGCMFKFTVNDPAKQPTPIPGIPGRHMDAALCKEIFDNHIGPEQGPIDFIGFNTHKIGGIPGHLSDPWADYRTEEQLAEDQIVQGKRYRIYVVGTTVWTTIGASANANGVVFTATGSAPGGTGICQEITAGIPRPNNWLVTPTGTPYGKGMGCGFDIHFNAYGTSCIALYSGYLDGDKYAVSHLRQGTEIPGVGTDQEVIGEFYMDRGTNDPANYHGTIKKNNSLRVKTAITRKETILIENAGAYPWFSPVVGDFVTNAPGGTGLQEPCIITAFDATAGSESITVSPAQTLAAGALLDIFTAIASHSYQNQNISKYIRERYVGANQPLLNFDSNGERFNFQQLHSPLYIGNEANAGDGLTAVALEEGKQVLEINRRLMGNDFTPEMMPYKTPITRTANPSDADRPPIQPMNTNLIPWQVYDSDGGIFLENFGLTPAQWDLSLWGVLGFSYGQFHPTGAGNRQARINNIIETTNLLVPTTNANLEASDVVKFRGNRYGSSLYTFQPPIASCLGPIIPARQQREADYPVIVIDQISAQINAANLPRKMLKPFFLIKSNIIGDMSYWGGGDSGQNLPVVCVVNKENGFGDFYFQRGFDMEFTATIPRMITSITTSIHDPDMKLSNVGPDSSVIFKITKMNHANLDVVSDVLQQQQQAMMKHKDKLKFMAEEQLRQQARSASQEPITAPIQLGQGDIVDVTALPGNEQLGEILAQEAAGGLVPAPQPVAPLQQVPQQQQLALAPVAEQSYLEPEPMPDSPIDVGTNDPQEKDMSRKRLGGGGVAPGRAVPNQARDFLANLRAQQAESTRVDNEAQRAAEGFLRGTSRPRTPERRAPREPTRVDEHATFARRAQAVAKASTAEEKRAVLARHQAERDAQRQAQQKKKPDKPKDPVGRRSFG